MRFRAMIQDTSLQSEMYLAKLSNNKCGGWGIQPTHDDYESNAFDPDHLGTASVFWAVSVPGESFWRSAEFSRSDSSAHVSHLRILSLINPAASFPVHRPPQPHKFPVPEAPHIGVRVKVPHSSPCRVALLRRVRYTTTMTLKTCIQQM